MADIYIDLGNFPEAKRAACEAIEISRSVCDANVGDHLLMLANVLLELNELKHARETAEEAITAHRSIGHEHGVMRGIRMLKLVADKESNS